MSFNPHHRKAAWLLWLTALAIVVLGTWIGYAEHVGPFHGIYCVTGFATTAGCDLQMRTRGEYLLGEASMLLLIPLAASVIALFTAGLTASHVDKRHEQLKRHIDGERQP